MIGTLFDNRFRIARALGQGGMAEVYLAYDEQLERHVALKILIRDRVPTRDTLSRFYREFNFATSISHPNIIKFYYLGETPDGLPFFTMEYIDGITLTKFIGQNQPVVEHRCREIISQMVSACAAFHETGIVHRDLKPDNIMLAGDITNPRAVVMDFGLAYRNDITELTATGALVGTALYLSPESLMTSHIDHRADIFQIGVIAYELITGVHPFEGESLFETLNRIECCDFRPASALRPDINPQWDQVLERCLAPKPQDRYQKASDLLNALDFTGRVSTVKTTGRRGTERGEVVESPTRSKYIGFAAAISIVLVTMLCYVMSGPPENFNVRDLRVLPGDACLTVTWASETPYASEVVFTRPEARSFRDPSGVASTGHKVFIDGLKPGGSYTFAVRYPDGSLSLPRKVQIPLLKLFVQGEMYGEDLLRLNFSGLIECRAGLLVKTLTKVEHEYQLAFSKTGRSTVSLDEKAFEITSVSLFAKTGGGRTKRFDVGRRLLSQTDDFCRQALSDSCNLVMVDSDGGKRVRAMLRRAYRLAPVVLGTNLLAPKVRSKFYVKLVPLLKTSLWAIFEGNDPDEWLIPCLGCCGLSLRPLEGATKVVIYRRLMKDDRKSGRISTGPASLFSSAHAADPPVRLVAHSVPTRKETVSTTMSFYLDNVEGIKAAQLFFHCCSLDRYCIIVDCNDFRDLILYDRPVLVRKKRRGASIFLRVPPWALRKGDNTIRLTYDSLPYRLSFKRWSVYEISLLIIK